MSRPTTSITVVKISRSLIKNEFSLSSFPVILHFYSHSWTKRTGLTCFVLFLNLRGDEKLDTSLYIHQFFRNHINFLNFKGSYHRLGELLLSIEETVIEKCPIMKYNSRGTNTK